MTWERLLLDETRSPVFNELHARIDNYQIYSIWIGDRLEKKQITRHQPAVQLPPVSIQNDVSFSEEYRLQYGNPTYTGTNTTVAVQYWKKLNIAPDGYPSLITIELRDEPDNPNILPIAQAVESAISNGYTQYGISPSRTFSFVAGQPYYGYFPVFTPIYGNYPPPNNRAAKIEVLAPFDSEIQADDCIVYQSFSPSGKIPIDLSQLLVLHGDRLFNGQNRTDYKSLISGHIKDARKTPSDILLTASKTRTIRYGYYRSNLIEPHPKISNTLDWFTGRIEVKKGEKYVLPIKDPMLGTLTTDIDTRSELTSVTQSNRYPCKYLFAEYAQELINQWDIYYPLPGEIDPPLASTWTITEIGQTPPLTYSVTKIAAITPTFRVMAATNNRWGTGTLTISVNGPTADHPLFDDFDHQAFFEKLQPDNSFGTYMTDSPRLIEIWHALEAGTYATDTDGLPRKVNIGWGVMKLLEVMGVRRQPNGKFLTTAESKKYVRTRVNAPKWELGDYGVGEWGKYGLAFKYLPTTYIDGQRQDDLQDIVHDLPQLLTAIVDQLDHSLNIQHGSEVRIPVGKDVQAYPNQGAATIDTAARIIQLERMVEQLLVMNIETSNSVRELFAGIGIPITTKAVKVDVGGQIRDIQYPGYQQSKPSMAESIGSLKSNLGLVIGALMPRKSPKDSPMNPWNWKKK